MSKEILTKPVSYQVNGQEVNLTGGMVKSYLTRGNETVTDQEIVMFINLCRYQKLNPFLNEAYLVKFKGAPAQIITSKEAYMKRAFEHPKFDGLKAGIIIKRGDEVMELEGSFSLPGDILLGGWAEVYVKDKSHPYVTKINVEEYSKGQATWKAMPKTMIRKTALVHALREAFPENLGTLYTDDEGIDKTVEDDVAMEIEQNANKQVIDIEESAPQQVKPVNQGQPKPIKEGQQSIADLYQEPGF